MNSFTPARQDDIAERLGYRFHNAALLTEALTHGSTQKHKGDYQRLEFLGDRVLGLIIAEHLFRTHPKDGEGQLTHVLSSLVRSEACADAGDTIGLSDMVIIGAGERAKGMNLNRTVLGDAMEALVAAIYLDGGLAEARAFVLRCWEPQLKAPKAAVKDPKTFLQEWALARALPIPSYKVVSRAGPEHEPVFVVSVDVKDKAPAEGSARNKRAAEMDAAEQFLKREGIRP
ncbi:ribonuclease III [Aestuariivirga litoralis]|uniref:Ribonuclease 3 n=1 Tax=Aestuariivirga litoralis TaxID=2650924 RepID=A0A2W2BKX8_9HYPH|nr:ribonuclease III [Aestuariivirga litoralis]PZF76889.1 ribonuclease III [Aestuariivirga litoralis]